MFRDQIQKQPTVRASLFVCTRRCHTLINTHKTSHARKHTHARTYMRTHEHTHTHTHTHTNARTNTHTTLFFLMSSYSCKRMSRDHAVRASLLVGTRNKLYTHARTHARTHTRTDMYTHTHKHTHTHTRLHYFRSLSVSLSPPHEKLSRYHPRTALVPFLSSQKPFPVPLGYPQTRGHKRCLIGTKNSQIPLSD